MKIRKFIHLWDAQCPYEIPALTGGILQYARDERVDGVHFGGDNLDLEGLQGWENKKPGNNDWNEVWSEIFRFRKILDIWQKALPWVKDWRWHDGNHELRLKYFLEKFGPSSRYQKGTEWYVDNRKLIPDLHGELMLKQRGFKIFAQKQLTHFGRLSAFHGDDFGANAERNNANLYGRSVIFGHIHRPGRFTKISPVDFDPISAWSEPCLCNRNPRWKRGSANSWSTGFSMTFVREGGFFNHYPVDIVRGQFVGLNGKLYGTFEG